MVGIKQRFVTLTALLYIRLCSSQGTGNTVRACVDEDTRLEFNITAQSSLDIDFNNVSLSIGLECNCKIMNTIPSEYLRIQWRISLSRNYEPFLEQCGDLCRYFNSTVCLRRGNACESSTYNGSNGDVREAFRRGGWSWVKYMAVLLRWTVPDDYDGEDLGNIRISFQHDTTVTAKCGSLEFINAASPTTTTQQTNEPTHTPEVASTAQTNGRKSEKSSKEENNSESVAIVTTIRMLGVRVAGLGVALSLLFVAGFVIIVVIILLRRRRKLNKEKYSGESTAEGRQEGGEETRAVFDNETYKSREMSETIVSELTKASLSNDTNAGNVTFQADVLTYENARVNTSSGDHTCEGPSVTTSGFDASRDELDYVTLISEPGLPRLYKALNRPDPEISDSETKENDTKEDSETAFVPGSFPTGDAEYSNVVDTPKSPQNVARSEENDGFRRPTATPTLFEDSEDDDIEDIQPMTDNDLYESGDVNQDGAVDVGGMADAFCGESSDDSLEGIRFQEGHMGRVFEPIST